VVEVEVQVSNSAPVNKALLVMVHDVAAVLGVVVLAAEQLV
jgi:hypothetical protein